MLNPVRYIGENFLRWCHDIGGLVMMMGKVFINFAPWKLDKPQIWRNMYRVGVKSFPIVVVTALLTGAIMVIQSGLYIEQYGAHGLLGWGAGYSVLREVGPIMIGLMFSGRVGANNTAELGTMKVTEQVDALRALAIDPISYLVMPRVIAMIVMMFLLVIVGDFTALLGGAVTSQVLLGVDMKLFAWSIVTYIELGDFTHGLWKAVAFGYAIAIISCHFGMNTSGGAVGVGRAVNASVVGSAIAIFVLDYFITFMVL
ncbi:ABC transporter permease [Persicimonas caeni]|uniref:ABC transporter permease n=1 Tax=Persicimonas caeni TaxID=2292766 RepID=A0A4Y6Q2Q3_PERCE|nr:ABC transporter permease [Persicimonas caeni]QDG54730.1 ABC transporter permease [Persicimonas caeni]QED35951.1 ABC transporter permease [Persicimonas caeni]